MTQPLLLVVSPDTNFSNGLTSRLNGAFHVLSLPTLEEAQGAIRQQPLWGLVARPTTPPRKHRLFLC